MSKISLAPNISGSAVYTIASPAGSTDRTLNLPDGSGALYNQSNILGTVSQSGGVPTGAIIERGSNANGEFVKYADGTMICTRQDNYGPRDAVGSGTLNEPFRTDAVNLAFAASFITAPSVSGSGGANIGGSSQSKRRLMVFARRTITTTQITTALFVALSDEAGSDDIEGQIIAIGRWF